MNIFLSKYINNIDAKGRVSVPPAFRTVLSNEEFSGIIAYPSFRNKCIEACSISRLKYLSEIIQDLDPYSEERDAFETIVLGEATQLPFDREGRVILSKSLTDHAGISNHASFVGKGQVFEIWQPESFQNYLLTAKLTAQNNRLTLKNIQKI